MALPATDAFTGTNGTALSTYSANWTEERNGMQIYSNAVMPVATDDDAFAFWDADTFDDDQYSEATAVALNASGHYWAAVVIRCSTNDTCWMYTGAIKNGDYGGKELNKWVDGTVTYVENIYTVGWSVNDVIRIEADGDTITPYLNGSIDTDLGAVADGGINSGAAGIGGYGNTNDTRVDDWEGGNLPTSVTVNAATLTATVQDVTATGGAVTVSVSSVSLTATPNDVTVDAPSGGTTVNVNAASLTATVQDVTATGGAVSVSLNAATLTASAQALVVLFSLYPIADTSLGSWVDDDFGSTNIYQAIDESPPSDTDYVQSPSVAVANTYKFQLSAGVDPGVHSNHIVAFRCKKISATAVSLKVRLVEGVTTRANWEEVLTTDWVTFNKTLTTEQAAAITNYSNLFLELEAV